MLRLLVLLLLLANLLFFAWAQGWLRGIVTVDPLGAREPHRLREQVRPDLIQVLPPGSVASAPLPRPN